MSLHIDYLRSLVELEDKKAIDVGAGDGSFSNEMAALGTSVTAVEIDDHKVDKGRQNAARNVRFCLGSGTNLSVNEGSQDLVCYVFSFHHVPQDQQPAALAEADRVLKSGGRLHIAEPMPWGSMTEVVKHIEDETEVRTRSHDLFSRNNALPCFKPVGSKEYTLLRRFENFEALVERIASVDPGRTARLPDVLAAMERSFDTFAEKRDGALILQQPSRAYHFRKV